MVANGVEVSTKPQRCSRPWSRAPFATSVASAKVASSAKPCALGACTRCEENRASVVANGVEVRTKHQPAPFATMVANAVRDLGRQRRRGAHQTYRGTSLMRNVPPMGPYIRPMSRALWWSWRGGMFLMSEVPLYARAPLSFPGNRRSVSATFPRGANTWPQKILGHFGVQTVANFPTLGHFGEKLATLGASSCILQMWCVLGVLRYAPPGSRCPPPPVEGPVMLYITYLPASPQVDT